MQTLINIFQLNICSFTKAYFPNHRRNLFISKQRYYWISTGNQCTSIFAFYLQLSFLEFLFSNYQANLIIFQQF